MYHILVLLGKIQRFAVVLKITTIKAKVACLFWLFFAVQFQFDFAVPGNITGKDVKVHPKGGLKDSN